MRLLTGPAPPSSVEVSAHGHQGSTSDAMPAAEDAAHEFPEAGRAASLAQELEGAASNAAVIEPCHTRCRHAAACLCRIAAAMLSGCNGLPFSPQVIYCMERK